MKDSLTIKLSSIVVIALAVSPGCGKPAPSYGVGGPDGSADPGDGSNGQPTDGRAVDAAGIDVPPHIPGNPGVGAHGLSYYKFDATAATSISSPALTTQPSGSTIVVSIGRGDISKFVLPTDNKGNSPYQQLGAVQTYPSYQQSGTALYAFTSAVGGSNFKVSTTTGPTSTGQGDEITMAAVEVIEGTRIRDFAWNKLNGPPLTSASVSTSGPATLIAFWWGDGFPGAMSQSAIPNNDFTPLDKNVEDMYSFVQCAVAVKNVTAAGTYNVTWTATPTQGAQMWLIAVD